MAKGVIKMQNDIVDFSSNEKGRLVESIVLSVALSRGISVSIPFGDKDRYDQIWDIDGKLFRVQIKTSSLFKAEKDSRNTSIVFSCRTVTHNYAKSYDSTQIDLYATYWDNVVYVIPVRDCGGSSKHLRFTSSQPNQPGITWAKDYTIDKFLYYLREKAQPFKGF